MESSPMLVALYVPGDRPDRFGKAVRAGADAVIIDLEDSVSPDHKEVARRAACEFLSAPPPCPIVVRMNGADSPWYRADLEALASCGYLSAVRLPKAETPGDIYRVADCCTNRPIQAVVETALGVENLFAIAAAAPTAGVSLGEADLRSVLSITAPDGLDWIRSRLVVAASAAGLPAPMMSVWTDVRDLDGLARSCTDGKARGFLGRAAIHPGHVPVIRDAFAPTSDEVDRARAVLDALAIAAANSSGVAVMPDGHMVDAAMRRAAVRTLESAVPRRAI